MTGCSEECVRLFATTDGTLLKSLRLVYGHAGPQVYGFPQTPGRIVQVRKQDEFAEVETGGARLKAVARSKKPRKQPRKHWS